MFTSFVPALIGMHLQGIRNVPTRIRVVIERRRNDDEDAKVRSRYTI